MEHIYSDALAMKLDGKREFQTPSNKFIDVYLESSHTIIEAKYRPRSSDVRSAIAQLIEHRRAMNGGNLQFHAVLSQQREARAAEIRAINEHRDWMAAESISLTTETARDLPSIYTIDGLIFLSRAEILAHCDRVKADFLVAEYLCDDHRSFLMALADGYCRVTEHKPAIAITPGVFRASRSAAMMVSVHSGIVQRTVPIDALVGRWLELTHYHWVYSPAHAGVCR